MFKTSKLGCSHPKVARRTRAGLFDAVMYRFGRYPWSCSLCGCKLYHRDRRASGRGRRSVVWEQPRTASSRITGSEGASN